MDFAVFPPRCIFATVASGSLCACTKLAATLSNCGNALKILIPNIERKNGVAENKLWYGKNSRYDDGMSEMGNLQPTPKGLRPFVPRYLRTFGARYNNRTKTGLMGAVQRLNGNGWGIPPSSKI